jgi:hypothetical protein
MWLETWSLHLPCCNDKLLAQQDVLGHQLHMRARQVSGEAPGEGFFGILVKHSLRATEFLSKKQLREHLAVAYTHWNQDPTPFIWTKPAAAIIRSHQRMLYRISHAVH